MRYLIAPIIGTGTRTDPYRTQVRNYVSQLVGVNELWPEDANGVPTSTWGLAAIADQDWALLSSDPNLTTFPNVASSTTFGSLSGSDRNKVRNWLTSHGLAAPTNSETMAQIVTRIGLSIDPNFNINEFTVG
jgi:hypothetical protein